jgi:hypothetical protein
MTKMM